MRVAISPRAERDLEIIGDYIAEDNPARAVTFIAELRDRFAVIADTPEAFRLRPELGKGVRFCAHGNYAIFFTVTKTRLMIVRVLHGAMDAPSRFPGRRG